MGADGHKKSKWPRRFLWLERMTLCLRFLLFLLLPHSIYLSLHGLIRRYVNKFQVRWLQLQRLVSAYLDLAEDVALRRIPMTMADWEERLTGHILYGFDPA